MKNTHITGSLMMLANIPLQYQSLTCCLGWKSKWPTISSPEHFFSMHKN